MLSRPVESYGPCNIPGNMYYLQLAYCLSFFVTRLGFDVFPVALSCCGYLRAFCLRLALVIPQWAVTVILND